MEISKNQPIDWLVFILNCRGFYFSKLTHSVPSKHFPSPHSQIMIALLLSGEQPQAPTRQEFGKSLADLQHKEVAILPPEIKQAWLAPISSWLAVSVVVSASFSTVSFCSGVVEVAVEVAVEFSGWSTDPLDKGKFVSEGS
ncbi:MAG: hypothetical protein WC387_03575, partial [Candidatus Paceibacterota bacterium]